MDRRHRIKLIAAWAFLIVNVLGIPFALRMGEGMHAGVHVALTALGLLLLSRLRSNETRRQVPAALEADERLQRLQASVDAIAIEVERIGEAQRFSAKVMAERARNLPPTSDA